MMGLQMNKPELKSHFLKLIESKYNISVNNGEVSIPDSEKELFIDETDLAASDDMSRGFFWQRLANLISSRENDYYRLKIPLAYISFIQDPSLDEKYLIFWVKVQYEAHHLIEESYVIGTTSDTCFKIDELELINSIEHFSATKIYFSEEEYDKRLKLLEKNVDSFLQDTIIEIQKEMNSTYISEVERIEEYYGHLISKINNPDELKRIKNEKKVLISETGRKLHPASLKIIVLPQFCASLSIVE
ncbi:MAG: hypothetical protein JXR95_10990 [Deltaproteobacteria bacterium]|nr:hypothetical protein [Deltaproteobacteria bacterium]